MISPIVTFGSSVDGSDDAPTGAVDAEARRAIADDLRKHQCGGSARGRDGYDVEPVRIIVVVMEAAAGMIVNDIGNADRPSETQDLDSVGRRDRPARLATRIIGRPD